MRSSFVPSQFLIRKFADLGVGSVNYSHFSQLYVILLHKFYLYICLVILLVILHQKEWQKMLQLSLYRGTCQVPRAVRILMPYSMSAGDGTGDINERASLRYLLMSASTIDFSTLSRWSTQGQRQEYSGSNILSRNTGFG